MFERFTERARQVVVLAQEEARALKHNYIGTEHLLLGLLREAEGVAAQALESLNVTLEWVRSEVVRIVRPGEELVAGQIPFTPRAKRVLELALQEGLSLGHNYIGTEHILLGLARENEGVAARILRECDVDPEKVRAQVIRLLSGGAAAEEHRQWRMRSVGRAAASVQPQAFGGLDTRFLNQLERDILKTFGREPDLGDLLLVLASAPETLSADVLRELGLEADALSATVGRHREQRARMHEELKGKIAAVRAAKEQAIEAQQPVEAARLRDQERELHEQLTRASIAPDALDVIRRRLGIPRRAQP